MATDPTQTARLLERAGLVDGRFATSESDVLLSQSLPADRCLPAWELARSVVAETGRWPVLVLDDEYAVDLSPSLDEARRRAFEAQVSDADPWAVLDVGWDEPIVEEEFGGYVRHRFPQAADDLERQMRADLGSSARELDIDRWLYDRLLQDAALRQSLRLGEYIGRTQWHSPPSGRLALLPTDRGWLAPLWVGYFGAADEPAALAAALLEWQRAWGAELVACWLTMLQLTAARRPTDPEDAWQLAGQLKAVGGSLQMYRYELAFALMQSDAWFLHDRP